MKTKKVNCTPKALQVTRTIPSSGVVHLDLNHTENKRKDGNELDITLKGMSVYNTELLLLQAY